MRLRPRESAFCGTGSSPRGSNGAGATTPRGWQARGNGHRMKEGGLKCYGFSVWGDVPSMMAEGLPYRKRGSMDKVRRPRRKRLNEKDETSAR